MKKRLLVIWIAIICVIGSACAGMTSEEQKMQGKEYAEVRSSHAEANQYQTDVTLSEEEQQLDQNLPHGKRLIRLPVMAQFLMICRF